MHRETEKISVFCLSLVLLSVAGGIAAQVPEARVSGPVELIPSGTQQRTLLNPATMDLTEHGYVEEEYFIEGTANRYTAPDLQTGEIRDGGHPYRSRFIVRRPVAEDAFNGTLVVEWNNVTAGRDLDIDWWQSGEYFLRNGYAFIAVSAQRVGVNHLREWNRERYGELDVTVDGEITDDALSYDIFAAVARAAMAGSEAVEAGQPDVLGGLQPELVLATGHSQSASRLGNYINHVHGLDPVFDGFMVHGGGGRLRDNQGVKIFRVMAETDMATRAAAPQPDSRDFRHWEVAGSSHVDIPFEQEYAAMLAAESGEAMDAFTPREQDCVRRPYSRVPFRYAMNAAFDHLRLWSLYELPPPIAPKFVIGQAGQPVVFERDGQGNIRGGIRLAAHEVPTATNTGMNSGAGFCRLYGSHEPFDTTTLEVLYPDRDGYLEQVRAAVGNNLASGFILPADAVRTLREAEAVSMDHW